jgi:hypothetical protein
MNDTFTALYSAGQGGKASEGAGLIAALFVETGGAYFDIPNVDPWDEARDARLYDGPYPVVAHPPCKRWSSLNNLVLARYPQRAAEFAHGNDGGCFASALASVRKWGGVLEHPAYSRAWGRFGLPRPIAGLWVQGICGGWSIEVDQSAFGHPARKRTWLYAYGVKIPVIRPANVASEKRIRVYRRRRPDGSWERMDSVEPTTEITHQKADATPAAFRDILIAMAESAAVPA